MEYKYMCDVKASDLWKMAMVRTYKAAIGVVNIVFTVAMILLVFRFWKTAPDILRVLIATYGMCVKQLENMPRDMELKFDDVGVRVSTGGESELIRWNKVKNAIKRSNMIVVMSDDSHGYMLTNRVLGNEKEEFYNFLCSKIRG